MATFDDFLNTLEIELAKFAESSWKTFETDAVKDGNDFLDKSKADLEHWTEMLKSGELTPEDFKFLVIGKKDLAELDALKRAGLAEVALDSFINGLIDTIVSTAFKVFL